MFAKIITWLESHMGTCAFHDQTGMICPGCGIQRSIIALLRGGVLESILLFPALLPLIAMFAFMGLHLAFRLRHGALILKILYFTNTALIAGNYICQIIIQ